MFGGVGRVVGEVIGGVARPVSEYGQAREETKQAGYAAWALSEVSAASWRTRLSLGTLLGLAFYVVGYTALMLFAAWSPVGDAKVSWLLVQWKHLGSELWSFASLWLPIHGGSKGVETATAFFGASRGGFADDESHQPTTREPMRRPSGPIERRLDGIVVPEAVERPAARRVTPVSGSQPWQWSARSEQRLSHAHADLQRLFDWLLPRSPYDLTITETARSVEQQRKNLAKGVSKTMDSRHLERPAMAVDFAILIGNRANWDIEKYREVTDIIKQGADALGIPVTCGIDWRTLVDGPHVELDRRVYPRQPSVLDEHGVVPA